MLMPLLLASTSEMHDILVWPCKGTIRAVGKRLEFAHASSMTTMVSLMFNDVCCSWHDCCSDTCAVVEISQRHTNAFNCPVSTQSAQRVTGSPGGSAQTSERDLPSLVQLIQ